MFRPRIIPVLLLKNLGLVKSIRFKNHRYIGDPINAVKLFNELKADELVFLNITSLNIDKMLSNNFIKNISDEAEIPFAFGGGINNIKQIYEILSNGAEKVILGKEAVINPGFVETAVSKFGSSSVVVCMDVRKNIFGKELVCYQNGEIKTRFNPMEFAKSMENCGAGEIIVQSIDNDGMMNGYNIDLLKKISGGISIPVVALGGAGSLEDVKEAYNETYSSAFAAGSMFIYQGHRRAILVNYPDKNEIDILFKN